MIKYFSLINTRGRLRAALNNTLFMSAFYLMLSTFILGACGFIFWVIVTRLYNTEAIGLATTLLSVAGLISLLGLAGFDTTFVRFLPGTKRKNDYINTGFIISSLTSLVIGIGVGIILPIMSPNLSLLANPWVFLSFVSFVVIATLSTLANAVFLAFKQTRYVLIITVLFSTFKILLPLLAVEGGAVAIFAVAGVAQLFGLTLSLIWMRRLLNYKISHRIHVDMLRVVRKFSLSVYTSNVLSLIPPALLPLIILHHAGAKSAAYYYIAYTIAGVLYTVVYASMQSAMAEGSHDSAALRHHIISALKFITVLLLPATLLILLLAGNLLSIFGPEYANGAGRLLQLLVIGVIPIATYSAITTTFKVTKQLPPIIYMNGAAAIITLGLASWLIPQTGLESIGWIWIIGNTVACGIGIVFLIKNKRGQHHDKLLETIQH